MSVTIGIRFLTGYCAAARSKTDPRPEWPPHPARVYMALAAAYFECEQDEDAKQALEWLESLEAPALRYSPQCLANESTPTFVPMNDSRAVSKGGTIQTIPSLKRHRAERLFPRTHLPPEQDCVYFTWASPSTNDIAVHRTGLSRLCSAVSRIGHSSSLVQVWLADEPSEDLCVLIPNEHGATKLRAVYRTSGTLDRAATAFRTPPNRLNIKTVHGYAKPEQIHLSAATTLFDDALEIFRLEPAETTFKWLQLETTLALARTLRDAILSKCDGPIPESISGHAPDGKPTKSPHIAVIPLPFVGSPHADGHLLGAGVVLPRDMPSGDLKKLIGALDKISDEEENRGSGLGFDSTRFPGLGQWRLVRQGIFDDYRKALQVGTWTGSPEGSHRWASVTPFVFDHHSKAKSKAEYLEECAGLVAEAVSRVVVGASLERVNVTPISPLVGVPPAYEFPRLKRKDGSERRQIHVDLEFDRCVVGPLLIGAGRFRGYGLCWPFPEDCSK